MNSNYKHIVMESNSTVTIENIIEEDTKKIHSKKQRIKKSNAKKPKCLKELLEKESKSLQKNLKNCPKKQNSIKSEDSYKISHDSKITAASESRDSISKNSSEKLGNKLQKNSFESPKEIFPVSLRDYFDGTIEHLKKKEKCEVDFSNSKNFITKEDFYKKYSVEKEDEKENINDSEQYEQELFENYNYVYDYNRNYNNGYSDFKNFEQKFKLQPFFTYPEIMIVESKRSKFDDFNDSNTFYDNIKYKPKNYNANLGKKKCNFFIRRRGDWLCEICGNLNFVYREYCNRCKAKKQ